MLQKWTHAIAQAIAHHCTTSKVLTGVVQAHTASRSFRQACRHAGHSRHVSAGGQTCHPRHTSSNAVMSFCPKNTCGSSVGNMPRPFVANQGQDCCGQYSVVCSRSESGLTACRKSLVAKVLLRNSCIVNRDVGHATGSAGEWGDVKNVASCEQHLTGIQAGTLFQCAASSRRQVCSTASTCM
jgi:hypothetical protein